MTEYVSIYKKTKEFITDNLSESLNTNDIPVTVNDNDNDNDNSIRFNLKQLTELVSKVEGNSLIHILEPFLFVQGPPDNEFLKLAKKYVDTDTYNIFYSKLLTPYTSNDTVTVFELLKNKNIITDSTKNITVQSNTHLTEMVLIVENILKEKGLNTNINKNSITDLIINITDDSNLSNTLQLVLNSLQKGGTAIVKLTDVIISDSIKLSIQSLSSVFNTSFLYRSRYVVGVKPMSYLVLTDYKDNLSHDFKQSKLNKQFSEEIDRFVTESKLDLIDKIQKLLSFTESWSNLSSNSNKKEIFNLSTYIKIVAYNQFIKKFKVNVLPYTLQLIRSVSADKTLLAKTYFPLKEGVNFNDLKISSEGYYSISKPYLGLYIIKIMKESVEDDLKNYVITDATGGNGGDSIYFAENFKFVNTVELNPEHCDIIKHNMNVYGFKNWSITCDSYDKVMMNLKQDIVYIDAPWGGPSMINLYENDVKLGNYYMYQLVNYIMFNFEIKYVVLKLPPNYALQKYYKFIDNSLTTVKIYNVYDNMMIIVNKKK